MNISTKIIFATVITSMILVSFEPIDQDVVVDEDFCLLSIYPDLTVTSINRSMLTADNQALNIMGHIFAEIQNVGDVSTTTDFKVVFFEDSNNNHVYEITDNLLGFATFSGSLDPGTNITISTNISGNIIR